MFACLHVFWRVGWVYLVFKTRMLPYNTLILQLEGGITHLPLLDSSMRATPLAPSEWRKRLEALNTIDGPSNENLNANYILLDVRNGMILLS